MEIVVYLLVVAAASVAAQSESINQIIPILSYTNENNYDGSYKYSYGTGNGINVEEEGSLMKLGDDGAEVQTARGKYSYTAPDGQLITVTWYADQTGFHADVQNTPQLTQQQPLQDKFASITPLAGAMFRGK